MKFLQEMIAKKKESHDEFVQGVDPDMMDEPQDRTAQELHSAAWETAEPEDFPAEMPRTAADQAAPAPQEAPQVIPYRTPDAAFDSPSPDAAAFAPEGEDAAPIDAASGYEDDDHGFVEPQETFEAPEPEQAFGTPESTETTFQEPQITAASVSHLRAEVEPDLSSLRNPDAFKEVAEYEEEQELTGYETPEITEPELTVAPAPMAEPAYEPQQMPAQEDTQVAAPQAPAADANVDASLFFDTPAEDRIMERTNEILAKTNPEAAAAAAAAAAPRRKIWDVPESGATPSAAAPAAPVSQDGEMPRRKAGRVKTRLLGFHGSDDPKRDVFENTTEKMTPNTPTMFPVGWIIVVEGPGKGASFPVLSGASKIGRGDDQTIRLDFGDMSISRDNHAAVAYDDEQRKFFLGHGGKANLVRLNDTPVLSTEPLSDGDKIRIGETTLRFVALCGPDFGWDAEDEANHRNAASS